jgi:ABC-type Mn2+/Zn2+ transport system ATPase subunit
VVEGLECGYTEPLLEPLDLELERGRFLLIEGPNGIGKSTILKTLVGLLDPMGGRYEWRVPGEELRFVPQVNTLDPVLPATVADVLTTGTQRGSGWASLRTRSSREDFEEMVERVDLGEPIDRLFRELSEGQKQLVLLARAFIGEPSVLVLDEPSASMDPERERHAIGLLDERRRSGGATVLLIAHGSQAAREACDMRIVIQRDRSVSVEYE